MLHAQKVAIKPVISTYISPIARIITILLFRLINFLLFSAEILNGKHSTCREFEMNELYSILLYLNDKQEMSLVER